MTNKPRGVLYIGFTKDLERRVIEHKTGFFPGFTKKYYCHTLVYFEHHTDAYEAIGREKQLKGLLRKKKIFLIQQDNPKWQDLSKDWF